VQLQQTPSSTVRTFAAEISISVSISIPFDLAVDFFFVTALILCLRTGKKQQRTVRTAVRHFRVTYNELISILKVSVMT
jgi:hypothetical protein